MQLFNRSRGGILLDKGVEKVAEGRPLLIPARELRHLDTRQRRTRRVRGGRGADRSLLFDLALHFPEGIQEHAFLQEVDVVRRSTEKSHCLNCTHSLHRHRTRKIRLEGPANVRELSESASEE